MRYVDRTDAGLRLAPEVGAALRERGHEYGEALVLGVPRGGVVVGIEIAKYLDADLDLALARKIGAPHNPELAIGAVGESGEPILADDLISHLGISADVLAAAIDQASTELHRRAEQYRGETTAPILEERVVVVADDGIATGATLRATLQTIREQSPALLVAAVPVGPPDSVARIAAEVDVMVCPLQPRWFRAVGEWYDSFSQTTDAEVIARLRSWGSQRGDS